MLPTWRVQHFHALDAIFKDMSGFGFGLTLLSLVRFQHQLNIINYISFFLTEPSIAQLVERRTVVENQTAILRSLVRLRLEGLFFYKIGEDKLSKENNLSNFTFSLFPNKWWILFRHSLIYSMYQK